MAQKKGESYQLSPLRGTPLRGVAVQKTYDKSIYLYSNKQEKLLKNVKEETFLSTYSI